MIYKQFGFQNKIMSPVSSDENDFNTLANMAKNPQQSHVSTMDEAKDFKTSQLQYLIAGDLQNGVRGNDTFKNASLVFVDFDDVDDEDKFLSTVGIKLVHYSYILYPSVSYGFKGTRYHLAVEPSRPLTNKHEKAACISSINNMLGVESDEAMTTWAQMFSAPVTTPVNKHGKIIIHTGEQKYDVDKAVADYKPAVKPVATVTPAATMGNHEAVLPDEYVHEKLAEYAYETHIETEKDFSDKMLQLIAYQQAGVISIKALDKAMEVLANGNGEWAADNKTKLAEHIHHQMEPNKMPFDIAFNTITPVHERADESRSYSAKSIALALSLKAATRLKELKKEQMRVNPRSTKEPVLSLSDLSDIMLSSVPMWMDRSQTNSAIWMWDAKKKIYRSDDEIFTNYLMMVSKNVTSKVIDNVKTQLRADDMVKDGHEEDSQWLVPCNNTIVDLKHMSKIDYCPFYHFVSKIATNFSPDALKKDINIDGWKPGEWLMSLACNDSGLYKLLFEIIGDAAQSNYCRQMAVWLVGNQNNQSKNGSNGKSTFETLIRAIVGDNNVANLKADQFSERFALNDLIGKSCVIGDDVQSGIFIENQSSFNSAVTGDVIRADIKNKQPISFVFRGTIIQSTNGLPKFMNQSNGTNRRMLAVPFNASFPAAIANDAIKTDYVHRQAVREWFLANALLIVSRAPKFDIPKQSKDAISQFAKGNDQLANFMDEKAEELGLTESTVVPLNWLYPRFVSFCDDYGFAHPLSRPSFTQRMIEYGWTKAKKCASKDTFHPEYSADVKNYEGKRQACLVKA